MSATCPGEQSKEDKEEMRGKKWKALVEFFATCKFRKKWRVWDKTLVEIALRAAELLEGSERGKELVGYHIVDLVAKDEKNKQTKVFRKVAMDWVKLNVIMKASISAQNKQAQGYWRNFIDFMVDNRTDDFVLNAALDGTKLLALECNEADKVNSYIADCANKTYYLNFMRLVNTWLAKEADRANEKKSSRGHGGVKFS